MYQPTPVQMKIYEWTEYNNEESEAEGWVPGKPGPWFTDMTLVRLEFYLLRLLQVILNFSTENGHDLQYNIIKTIL